MLYILDINRLNRNLAKLDPPTAIPKFLPLFHTKTRFAFESYWCCMEQL